MKGRAFDGGEEFVLRGVDQIPAQRDAAQFRVDQNGAVAIVPGEAQQAGLSGAIGFQPLRQLGNLGAGAAGDGLKDIACGRQPGLNASVVRMHAPGTTPQTPGISSVSLAMAMMQVEVPTTLTTSPSRQPAPSASQCASNAPTGMGMPARRPSSSAQSGDRCPARWSEVR